MSGPGSSGQSSTKQTLSQVCCCVFITKKIFNMHFPDTPTWRPRLKWSRPSSLVPHGHGWCALPWSRTGTMSSLGSDWLSVFSTNKLPRHQNKLFGCLVHELSCCLSRRNARPGLAHGRMSSISFEAGKCGATHTQPVEWKAIVVWANRATDHLLAIVRQEKIHEPISFLVHGMNLASNHAPPKVCFFLLAASLRMDPM